MHMCKPTKSELIRLPMSLQQTSDIIFHACTSVEEVKWAVFPTQFSLFIELHA